MATGKITRGETECSLNCCKCNFSQNCTLIYVIIFIIMTSSIQFQSWPRAISSEPLQFQVKPLQSSEPVQFQNKIAQSPHMGFVQYLIIVMRLGMLFNSNNIYSYGHQKAQDMCL